MEKRGYGRRTSVDVQATIQTGSRQFKARIIDVGVGGLALETETGIELDRYVRVRSRLLPEAAPLDVDGLVRRCEKRERSTRWGIELVNPTPVSLSLIAEYVNRQEEAARQESATVPSSSSDAADAGGALPAAEDSELKGLFDSALASLGY